MNRVLKNKILFVFIRIPAPCILLISIYLSSQPVLYNIPGMNVSDKLVHVVCFAGLCAAWCLWWPQKYWLANPFRAAFVTAFCVCLYGIADEYHQFFTPGREASVLDWAADSAGAVLGAVMGFLAEKAAYSISLLKTKIRCEKAPRRRARLKNRPEVNE
ncbi:MAG: VanZ family protein [Spirochaetaceae bacterium]|jgi:hypothetical protein|nr:VanZ family protein [Spirochaetaceae bacterium]